MFGPLRFVRLALLPLLICCFCFPVLNEASGKEGRKYYKLTPEEIVSYAQSTEGRKAIFLYASWCPHCRNAFPKIMELERQKSGSIIAVSLDKDSAALSRYLSKYSNIPFHVIIMKGRDVNGIERILNAKPHRGVPHFILLDESGKPVKSANMRISDVAKYILK